MNKNPTTTLFKYPEPLRPSLEWYEENILVRGFELASKMPPIALEIVINRLAEKIYDEKYAKHMDEKMKKMYWLCGIHYKKMIPAVNFEKKRIDFEFEFIVWIRDAKILTPKHIHDYISEKLKKDLDILLKQEEVEKKAEKQSFFHKILKFFRRETKEKED